MKYFFSIFLLFFLLNSCISDEESQRQVNSGFQGKWSGTFKGDFSGIISFSVEKEGIINGKLTNANNNTTENFQGYVNFNGKFDINTVDNYFFSGYLDNITPISGQWKKIKDNIEYNGTWTLTKQ
jgi:hypothetical protein